MDTDDRRAGHHQPLMREIGPMSEVAPSPLAGGRGLRRCAPKPQAHGSGDFSAMGPEGGVARPRMPAGEMPRHSPPRRQADARTSPSSVKD